MGRERGKHDKLEVTIRQKKEQQPGPDTPETEQTGRNGTLAPPKLAHCNLKRL